MFQYLQIILPGDQLSLLHLTVNVIKMRVNLENKEVRYFTNKNYNKELKERQNCYCIFLRKNLKHLLKYQLTNLVSIIYDGILVWICTFVCIWV